MPYSYKVLAGPDVETFKDLLRVFGEAFEDIKTYQGSVPGDGYLKSLLEKDHFIAIAAMDGDSVAGGLAAYVLPKFEQERKEIYIYDLAVLEAYRRKGIATALINKLKEIAREKHVWMIYVQADKNPEDEPARKLYEKIGAKEEVLHYDIDPNA